MSDTEQITVTLPRDVMDRVRHAVEAGEYTSESEAVEAAVMLWDVEHVGADPDAATLRRLVAEGLASGEPIEADVVFGALRARIGRARAAE